MMASFRAVPTRDYLAAGRRGHGADSPHRFTRESRAAPLPTLPISVKVVSDSLTELVYTGPGTG